ncbi:MAG: metallophosphoesterase family protein [Thermoanaerobaculia bacterium]
MKTLVISDLHANLSALDAVLAHAKRKGATRVICMGDFVGYGAQPNQVLDRVRRLRGRKWFIRGNHDRVASGADDGSGFNQAARHAAIWTREHLSKENAHFLRTLPLGPVTTDDGILLCHGSPFDEDEYVFSEYDAHNILRKFPQKLVLFGHTHLPSFFVQDDKGGLSGWLVRQPSTFKLEKGKRYLVNPGSVGQPRDRNSMAAYAMIDHDRETVHFLRVEYDIRATQQSILAAGLPRVLADRLAAGA